MFEQKIGIHTIGWTKHNRSRGQGCSCFSRHIRTGILSINPVGGPVHRHYLRRTPERVIGAAVADLRVEHVGRRMGLDNPVGAPLQ